MDNKFGTVTFEGKEYTLTQQACADNYGTDGAVRYYAAAVDEAGNPHRVAWDTTPEWNKADENCRLDKDDARSLLFLEDEANACDWDSPASVRED